MGRAKRADYAGGLFHMLNRANGGETLFHKEADYEAFERILEQAKGKFEVDLFSYCLMPNHWHFVVRPRVDREMSRFAQWVALTHTQRHHAHFETVGKGHLYQGRYKSFPIQADDHFLAVNRYVERNPLTAGLCQRAEDWRWSSLWRREAADSAAQSLLDAWPLSYQGDYLAWVAQAFSAKEIQRMQYSINRGAPYGAANWVETIARKYDLESTLRSRGRPRKVPAPLQRPAVAGESASPRHDAGTPFDDRR